MNQSVQSSSITAGGLRVAIIHASWHEDIVLQAVQAIEGVFAESGVPSAAVQRFKVPGAFEIPLHAQRLARSGQFDAIIACGLVVDGGIYRHDFVATAVIDGLMKVQLQEDVPVFSVVLTPHHFHDHADHQTYYHAHFVKKGQEAAKTCLATVESLATLPSGN